MNGGQQVHGIVRAIITMALEMEAASSPRNPQELRIYGVFRAAQDEDSHDRNRWTRNRCMMFWMDSNGEGSAKDYGGREGSGR